MGKFDLHYILARLTGTPTACNQALEELAAVWQKRLEEKSVSLDAARSEMTVLGREYEVSHRLLLFICFRRREVQSFYHFFLLFSVFLIHVLSISILAPKN